MRHVLLAVTVGLLAAAVQAGDVYKWVDKDGRVHYGDQPKHPAEQVDIRTGATTVGPDAQAAQARAADCERKKALLESYRNAATIRETDPLGRTREYSEQERLQLLAVTEKQANEACNPAATAAAPPPSEQPAVP